MNWGYGIAIVYGIFVAGMLGAVIASTQHDPGLISKNYYDLDLHYQAHFDKKQHTADLATALTAAFDAGQRELVLVFPDSMPVQRGSIQFRRTSTTKDDFLFPIPAVAGGGELRIPAAHMAPGRWLMDIEWESEGKGYFYATSIAVSPTK
ncbi:MAG: FixH family protein [Saprospiraceae bacterium]